MDRYGGFKGVPELVPLKGTPQWWAAVGILLCGGFHNWGFFKFYISVFIRHLCLLSF